MHQHRDAALAANGQNRDQPKPDFPGAQSPKISETLIPVHNPLSNQENVGKINVPDPDLPPGP